MYMKRSLKVLVAGLAATAVVAAPLSASAQDLPEESIAELAVANGLDTLVTAVTLAGLAEALSDCSYGPVTVFAPTDDAFGALPADVLEAALADPEGLLTDVLLYHVVPGIVPAEEVVAATSLTTAGGGAISVDGTVLNGTVNIVATDVFACNGVVHVIDGVLLPPAADEPAAPVADLPATGVNSSTIALTAAAALLGGLAIVGVTRRRTEV
jgi:transforming growth factor-beta-induced protein